MTPTHPILAADTGGTFIKLGVVHAGTILAWKSIPARSDEPLAASLPRIAGEWESLCQQTGIRIGDCAGIGISFPSIIDPTSGRVLTHFGKYADAPDLNLKDWASARFGLPLSIENDARAALIGEWQQGAGRGYSDLVMITLGTGIGTAALQDGKPLRGAHGQACGVGGHFTLNVWGETCPVCGNIGCAEQEASSATLAKQAVMDADFKTSPLSLETAIDYARVFAAAAAGDPCAIRLRDRALKVWGAVAANLVLAHDVPRLIVGGGIAKAPEVVPAIRDHLQRHAMTPWGNVGVVSSTLGDTAALLGCEWIGRQS